ncbi:MAG: hypothetical protein WBA97_13745 [Actinophytocola sp.]|uniref:hypothetical protein n=1 Tax=Actinophytocola sp. TaxID=1872138 RepID=UPI003C7683B8
MANQINYDGLTVTELYEAFTTKGIEPAEASILVSSWIYENVGRTRRVFNYVQPFPGTEPACQPPPFARTFQHDDWVDGENVVQAGATTGELGFNERFHRIEADLDHLGSDVARAFTCMATMRASLRTLLDELRAEINRIHDATHEFKNVLPLTDKTPNYVGVLDVGKYMGTTKFLEKTVSVWETKTGTIVLPAVETLGVDVVLGPKLKNAAMLGRFVVETDDVDDKFPRSFELAEFLDAYGDDQVGDGRTIRDVLKVLPASARFESIAEMVDETGSREAAIVRTTLGAQSAVAAALGIDADLEEVVDADIAKLGAVPTKARAVMARAGIDTVGALADASRGQLLELMQQAGVRATQGDVAEWISFARTMSQLR